MNYEILFTDEGERNLLTVPLELVNVFEEHLQRLAAHPATLSHRGNDFLSPPNAQIFHFEVATYDGGSHVFNVFFRYGMDEHSLWIIGIGHYPTGNSLDG
jgi:hypothetical protein